MKAFRRKELRDIWSDERAMVRHYRKIWDSSPALRAFYRDMWGGMVADASLQPMVEVGGGAGFLREFHPDVWSTDFLPFPESDVQCDASRLPFADNVVGSILGAAFFHHCMNPRRFFTEVERVLKPGGRLVIFDPYITPLSRIVYHFGTDETCDLSEAPFEEGDRETPQPLLEANIARATIVFLRNRALFEETFPNLRVVKVEGANLFTHLIAGSCVQHSPFPAFLYPVVNGLDRVLRPFHRLMGMRLQIVLEKVSPEDAA